MQFEVHERSMELRLKVKDMLDNIHTVYKIVEDLYTK